MNALRRWLANVIRATRIYCRECPHTLHRCGGKCGCLQRVFGRWA